MRASGEELRDVWGRGLSRRVITHDGDFRDEKLRFSRGFSQGSIEGKCGFVLIVYKVNKHRINE